MAKKVAKKAKKIVKRAATKKAVKKVAKKKVTKMAKKTIKKAAKKSAKKKAVKKVAEKTAKKAVKKKSVKKAVKKAVKKTVKKATKKAVKKTVKAAPKKTSRVKKIKTKLTTKQLKTFKSMLLEKRKSLIGDMNGMQLSSLGINMQDSSGDLSNMPTHMADMGSDNFEHEFTLELLESERKLLHEINEALERIDDKTFGICLGTSKPIGMARLKARPWCKYSIEYKRLIEQGVIRPGQTLDDIQQK